MSDDDARLPPIEIPPMQTAEEFEDATERELHPPNGKGNGGEPLPKQIAPAFSDESLALLFAARHAGDLRYVAEWGKWLSWTGTHWRFDDTLHAFNLARQIAREAAATCNKPGEAKMIASSKTAYAIERLAKADRRLAAIIEQWDADLWLLNTLIGVVDLRIGRLRPHRPDDYMTKITAVGPSGDCPGFLAFLNKIMGGDEALVAYLQRVFGYCLTGDTSEQAMFFNYGGGQNGKTVLMSTVAGIFGNYCCATPIETFTESKIERHPTELARLYGARLVTATETEAGRHWAESRLKEVTGGERVPARFMHKNFFEYLPTFKPFISGNHRPRLRSVGVAMRRRVNMIPFAVKIADSEVDPQLADKLKAEWPGILQWMVAGCIEWQEIRLKPPEAVTQATDAYFAGEDGYSDWIADRCEVTAGFWSRSSDLFASWKDWAEKAGQHAGDSKRFREEMERLGHPLKHTKTGNFYVGLCIRQDPPERDSGDW
jgi:putative DNA primase/helicase